MFTENPAPEAVHILKSILLRRMERNSAYSLRAFSRDLGVCHSYISQVLNGRRRLSLHKAAQFCKVLDLSVEESTELLRLLAQEHAQSPGSPLNRTFSNRKPSKKEFTLEVDRFRCVSEWYHGALVELIRTSRAWTGTKLAARMGIPEPSVRTALARLKRLGIVRRQGKHWQANHENTFIAPPCPHLAVRKFHRQMLTKAIEELEKESAEDFENREFGALTFTIDRKNVPEAKRRITAFRKQLAKTLGKGNPTEVYQLNVQLFPLLCRQSASTGERRSEKMPSSKTARLKCASRSDSARRGNAKYA